MPATSRQRLFVDESGDHSIPRQGCEIGKRYLGVVGVSFAERGAYLEFEERLNSVKARHFRSCPAGFPVLHREEICRKTGPFSVLVDPRREEALNDDLLTLIGETPFRLYAVVIDKLTHGRAGHRRLQHPYHYCLHALLERYCGYMDRAGARGDVYAESRGAQEDKQLLLAYREVYQHGTEFLPAGVAQRTLTSSRLEISKKKNNLAGIQLADLLARLATRDVLHSYGQGPIPQGRFTDRLLQAIQSKYNAHFTQHSPMGYGKVILY